MGNGDGMSILIQTLHVYTNNFECDEPGCARTLDLGWPVVNIKKLVDIAADQNWETINSGDTAYCPEHTKQGESQ